MIGRFKLNNVYNEDCYNAIKDEFSDSAIYHCCGDSISVTILVGLFGELTDLDYRSIIENYVEKEIVK